MTAPASDSRKRVNVPSDRKQVWYSKLRVLSLVFLAAIALTIYFYLDQYYFAPNRPLIWTDFNAPLVEKAIADDRVVVVLVGDFSNDDRDVHADYINVPVVRSEAYRLTPVFTVLQIDDASKAGVENLDWLNEQLTSKLDRSLEPIVILFFKHWDTPQRFESNIKVSEKLVDSFKSIRRGDHNRSK